MANDDSPTAALLSNSQRDWLANGAPDPESAAHRSLRMRIRKRVAQSFLDFALLENLPDDDLAQVFAGADDDLVDGMIAVMAVIYRGTHPMIQYHSSYTPFETLLKRAIAEVVVERRDDVPDPSHVEVHLEDGNIGFELREGAIDLEEIGEKIATGETGDLDREQLEYFVDYYQRSGELDPEAPAAHQRREWEDLQERREERGTDE